MILTGMRALAAEAGVGGGKAEPGLGGENAEDGVGGGNAELGPLRLEVGSHLPGMELLVERLGDWMGEKRLLAERGDTIGDWMGEYDEPKAF